MMKVLIPKRTVETISVQRGYKLVAEEMRDNLSPYALRIMYAQMMYGLLYTVTPTKVDDIKELFGRIRGTMELQAAATLELVNAEVCMGATAGTRADLRWRGGVATATSGVRETLRTMQGSLEEGVNADCVRHLFPERAWKTASGEVDPSVKLFRVILPQHPDHEHIVLVRERDTTAQCTCPFWTMWGIPCRHYWAVWQKQSVPFQRCVFVYNALVGAVIRCIFIVRPLPHSIAVVGTSSIRGGFVRQPPSETLCQRWYASSRLAATPKLDPLPIWRAP